MSSSETVCLIDVFFLVEIGNRGCRALDTHTVVVNAARGIWIFKQASAIYYWKNFYPELLTGQTSTEKLCKRNKAQLSCNNRAIIHKVQPAIFLKYWIPAEQNSGSFSK